MDTPNLFISHSWAYSDAYEKLISLLEQRPYFEFKNYSIPKDDPIHNATSTDALKIKIEEKIMLCSCVIILAGVYSSYSKWIDIEIELAIKHNKKIIAVEPWGAEKTSQIVKENANYVVKWNSDSIVEAIRK